MNTSLTKIDHAAIKTSQAVMITINIMAFILNIPWLAALVTLFMILGTILKAPAFAFIYRVILKPIGLVKPDIRLDNHEPHRFAQALGGLFMLAASIAFFVNGAVLGWGLVWLVTGLGALNLFAGFCVGCMMYYWLTRLNAPGFDKSPPEGTTPGMRPKTRIYHES